MKRLISLVLVLVLVNLYEVRCQTNLDLYSVSITYANRGNQTDFYVTTSFGSTGVLASNAWLGVGINNASIMNGGNAVICRNGPSVQFVQSNLNQNYNSAPFVSSNTLGLSGTSIAANGNNLTCSFSRANSASNPNYISVNTSDQLYFIVAFGTGNLIFKIFILSERSRSNEWLKKHF